MTPRWILPEPVDAAFCRQLAECAGVAPFVAELLCQRGMQSVEAAEQFLSPRLSSLGDPFLLPQMAAAVQRIFRAVDREERIVLYGDYDVDGVTSLALLTRILWAFGATSRCFLPDRMEEGYGLSADGIARCVSSHAPQLLIAVDCGTASVEEIASLSTLGIDAIVLDHHEGKAHLPQCAAVVNPKLGHEHHYFCSVGLVFKLGHALLKTRPLRGFDLREYLDLVALGTVADLVPIAHENRILVKRGLTQLQRTRWPGLRALLETARIRFPVTCSQVAFGLAPRLNAAGRLGTAQGALELLLTEDHARAHALALILDEQNRERRQVEEDVLQQAETQLADWFDAERDAAIVVGGAGWHPGVVGIVASRLMKRHHRPTFVIGFDENGLGRGSGRSIEGLSLVQALHECGGLLEKFGGHAMAAGVTLQQPRFIAFRDAFRSCASAILASDQLQPHLHLDAELHFADIDFELLCQHEVLQPFGMGNTQPVFLARRITLGADPRALKERHLSLTLRQDDHERRAIWFGAASEILPPPPWDIAFQLERSEYEGYVTPQIQIRAVRPAEMPRRAL